MAKDSNIGRNRLAAPFLAQFAVHRGEAAQIPGAYCPVRHVWVVESDEGPMPLVLAPIGDILEIQTKTSTTVEADDHLDRPPNNAGAFAVPLSALLEITTKTEANLESEDVVTRH